MWAVGKLFSNAKALYKEINSATLTGAIDVVAVEQEDGSYVATPFHVRFGKLGVIRSKEKVVYIEINGEPCDLCMKLGDDGEAFFVENTDEQPPRHLMTSPIPAEFEKEPDGRTAIVPADKRPASELSRVLSDSALFVSAMREQHRERHDSEGGTSALIGGSLVDPTASAIVPSTMYFEPIGGSSRADSSETESSRTQGGRDQQPNSVGESVANRGTFDNSAAASTASHRKYPLSDVEITPVVSPIPSRPASPKSDTELEIAAPAAAARALIAGGASSIDSGLQQWNWGELPRRSSTVVAPGAASKRSELIGAAADANSSIGSKEDPKPQKGATDDNQTSSGGPSGSGGLLSFMRKHKSGNKIPEDQGIYLEDLKLDEMDPELAALYFPKRLSHDAQKDHNTQIPSKDEDQESGSGPSLPHSPNTVMELQSMVAASPAVSETDTTATDQISASTLTMFNDIAMSLCGGLKDAESSITVEKFMHHLVTFEDFCKDPNIFSNQSLVIRMHGKYYSWKAAAPQIMSLAMFNMPLPEETVASLIKQHMPKEERRRGMFSSWWGSKPKVDTATKDAPSRLEKSKGSEKAAATDAITGSGSLPAAVTAAPAPAAAAEEPKQDALTSIVIRKDGHTSGQVDLVASVIDSGDEADDETTAGDPQYDDGRADHTAAASRSAAAASLTSGETSIGRHLKEATDWNQQQTRYRKTLRLTSDQLKRLKLHEGSNEIEYSVTTALQGTTRCVSHVFLWKWTDKIVVSDIDGTITRSDVLGQILPMVGKDWSQGGVVQLYNRIASNGYKFVYLSARAIGQAQYTRDYLKSVRQQQASLPPGPLLLSPTSLVQAFQKEVIERKPEEFKISCLTDLKSLFPDYLAFPLYAGFGNKINDVWAYRAVGIPMSRIFTINPKGELRHELSQSFVSSYTQLSDLADHFFPPLKPQQRAQHDGLVLPELSDFGSFAYWRTSPALLPDLIN